MVNHKAHKLGLNNIETYVGDITQRLPITKHVDKVLCAKVIQHLPTKEVRDAVLTNFYDQLNTGGVAVLTLYNYGYYFDRWKEKEGKMNAGIYYH